MKLPKRENLIVTNEEDPLNFYYYPFIGWVYRKRLKNTLALLGDRKFETLLEIGFGSGILFLELAERARELHGIEIHDQIQQVTEKMRNEGIRPILKRSSVYKMPYEDNTFDCIVSVSTFEHLEDLERAFREIKRIAKPGSLIVLSFPVKNVITDAFYKLFGYQANDIHPNSHTDLLNSAQKYFRLLRIKKFPDVLPQNFSLYLSCLFENRL